MLTNEPFCKVLPIYCTPGPAWSGHSWSGSAGGPATPAQFCLRTRPALNLLYTSINQSGQTRYLCRFRLDFSAGLHLIFEVESAFCESSVFSVVPHVYKQDCMLVILFELLIIMTATIRSRLNYSSFPLQTVILILENVSQNRI